MTIYRGQGGLGDSYNDPELVHTSGDETIEGVKTFTSVIIGTASGHYTKAEEDTKLALKANQSTTYTKTEVDTLVTAKADQSTTYTKTEVDTALTGKISTANGSVGTNNLADNAVTTAKIADSSVTTAKINNAAVTDVKIADVSASKLTGDVAAARITSALNASGSAPIYACRAWVNFNGTGTVAIRGSGNVSSITDNGTGDYTINFTTAMPDVNYNIVGSICGNLGVRPGGFIGVNTYGTAATEATPVVGNVRITTMDGSNSIFDAKYVNVSIFR